MISKELLYKAHLAGDGSFKENVIEFYQFKLNLILLKISYFPDFKNDFH